MTAMTPRRPLAALFVLMVMTVRPAWATLSATDGLPPGLEGAAIEALGAATVRQVEPGGALLLDDGRRAMLAGIELPNRPLSQDPGQPWPPAEQAATELTALAADGPLALYGSSRHANDRYGRLLVHAVTADGRWLQEELLRRGWARVAVTADARSGAAALFAAEDEARHARRGIWTQATYRVRRPNELRRYLDSVQVVEGTVTSADMVKGEILVNLGEHWRRGLTLRVPRALLTRLPSDAPLAGVATAPWRLRGARLRVRGWVGKGIGPMIDVGRLEQIEVLSRPGGRIRQGDESEGVAR